jgi:hypothetical protein
MKVSGPMADDPRTVTLDAHDWMAIIDAIRNDELISDPTRERITAAIREQARVA